MLSSGILTLCEPCAVFLQDAFRVTKISHPITTEKQPICQQCRKKYRDDLLAQYTVTAKRK